MRRLTKRERIAARNRPVTVYLERAVLAAFKASGKDWQKRVNEALRDWLLTHSPV